MQDECRRGRSRAIYLTAAGGLLLLGFVARLLYAYGLPLNGDELHHLQTVRQIVSRPAHVHIPLGSPGLHHPLGVVYLTALADRAGGGSVLCIRLTFVALSMLGLVGVYVLAASMFDRNVALLALALAALDRHLVVSSPLFLESPAVISLAPWAILAMRNCLVRGWGRDWLSAGLLFGLGYWLSMLFMGLLLPFGISILLTYRPSRILKSWWMYAGLGLMLAIMLPHVTWNLINASPSYERHLGKLGAIGLSPRMVLLYVGDLLICLRDPLWIAHNAGGPMYAPTGIPCDWAMGMVYMVLAGVSVRFWRDGRIGLLLLVIAGFIIQVTLIGAREPWNEFSWASLTVFPAIILTAFVIRRVSHGMSRRVVVLTMLGYSGVALSLFLAGPKWGYFCPEWERFYAGQVMFLRYRSQWNPREFPRDRAGEAIRDLTDRAIARHPESITAWYYRGEYAESAAERAAAFARALEIDPNNPVVMIALADDLAKAGHWTRARDLLKEVLAQGWKSFGVYQLLAVAEYKLGNFLPAIACSHHAAAMKPEDREPYLTLYAAYDAVGEESKAEASLKAYVAKHQLGPAVAYLTLAAGFYGEGKTDSGRMFLERAIRSKPHRPEDHALIALMLVDALNDMDRAIEHWETAIQLGSADPNVYCGLGIAMEDKGDPARAIECYEEAIRMAPDDAGIHARLGVLLADQNRIVEATAHLQAAKRSGLAIPPEYDGLLRAESRTESGR